MSQSLTLLAEADVQPCVMYNIFKKILGYYAILYYLISRNYILRMSHRKNSSCMHSLNIGTSVHKKLLFVLLRQEVFIVILVLFTLSAKVNNKNLVICAKTLRSHFWTYVLLLCTRTHTHPSIISSAFYFWHSKCGRLKFFGIVRRLNKRTSAQLDLSQALSLAQFQLIISRLFNNFRR